MNLKILSPALFTALIVAASVFAADYQASLGPMPLDDETKVVIAGRGEATATSDGKTLTVKGVFHGLIEAIYSALYKAVARAHRANLLTPALASVTRPAPNIAESR